MNAELSVTHILTHILTRILTRILNKSHLGVAHKSKIEFLVIINVHVTASHGADDNDISFLALEFLNRADSDVSIVACTTPLLRFQSSQSSHDLVDLHHNIQSNTTLHK